MGIFNALLCFLFDLGLKVAADNPSRIIFQRDVRASKSAIGVNFYQLLMVATLLVDSKPRGRKEGHKGMRKGKSSVRVSGGTKAVKGRTGWNEKLNHED